MPRGRRPPRGGPTAPTDSAPIRIQGVIHTRQTKFGLKVRIWPRKRPGPGTPGQQAAQAEFVKMVRLVQSAPSWDRAAAQIMAHDTGWTWRDVLSTLATGSFWSIPGLEQSAIPHILDALSDIEGAILYRGPDGWVGLVPASDGEFLSLSGGLPIWSAGKLLPPQIEVTYDLSGTKAINYTNVVDYEPGLPNEGHRWQQRLTGTTNAELAHLYGDDTFAELDLFAGAMQLYGDATVGQFGPSQAIPLELLTDNNVRVQVGAAGGVVVDGAVGGNKGVGSLNADHLYQGNVQVVDRSGPVATTSALGLVKPDGSTIHVDGSGLISAIGSGGGTTGLFGGAGLFAPLAADFTNVNFSAGAFVSYGANSLTFADTTATTNERAQLIRLAAQTPPYRWTVLLKPLTHRDRYNRIGIGWYDGTKVCFLNMNSNNGLPQFLGYNMANLTTLTSAFGTFINVNDANVFIWLRIADNGTSVFFRYSLDGENWITYFTVAKASGFMTAWTYPCFVIEAFNNNTGDIYGGALLSARVEATAP